MSDGLSPAKKTTTPLDVAFARLAAETERLTASMRSKREARCDGACAQGCGTCGHPAGHEPPCCCLPGNCSRLKPALVDETQSWRATIARRLEDATREGLAAGNADWAERTKRMDEERRAREAREAIAVELAAGRAHAEAMAKLDRDAEVADLRAAACSAWSLEDVAWAVGIFTALGACLGAAFTWAVLR